MRNIKDVILTNQKNQDFMARVEHSLSIENLYSVLCEYGYSSDMNEFEQEIYDILKNSDLVKNSVSDDELEQVSGGVKMRQKIMSIVALVGLTAGATQNFVGAAPKHNVSVSKTTKTSEYKKPKKHTKPPAKEIAIPVIGGVGLSALILSVLARNGNNYIKKQTFSNGTNTDQNNTYTESAGMQNLQLEPQEMTYEQALEVVKKFFADSPSNLEEYPNDVYDAVLTIREILFPDDSWKVATVEIGGRKAKLKSFPTSKQSCIGQSNQFFVPLSWQNGAGEFERDDDYMLYKCLFQYLCRMLALCPIMTEKMTEKQGYQYTPKDPVIYHYEPVCRDKLLGCRTIGNSEIPDYHNLFVQMVKQMQEKKLVDTNEYKLCQTLQAIYDAENSRLQKFGVFCGKEPRNIDN